MRAAPVHRGPRHAPLPPQGLCGGCLSNRTPYRGRAGGNDPLPCVSEGTETGSDTTAVHAEYCCFRLRASACCNARNGRGRNAGCPVGAITSAFGAVAACALKQLVSRSRRRGRRAKGPAMRHSDHSSRPWSDAVKFDPMWWAAVAVRAPRRCLPPRESVRPVARSRLPGCRCRNVFDQTDGQRWWSCLVKPDGGSFLRPCRTSDVVSPSL